jgi:YD repeat-containing protein
MGVKEARARRGRVRESMTGVLRDDGGRASFCQDNGGGVEMKSVNIWAGWSVSWAMKTAILNSFLTLAWFALMPAAEPVQVATLPKTGETARDAAGRLVRQSTASGNQVVTRDAAGRLLVKSTRQGDATVHRDASGRLVGNTTVSGKGKETTRDASGRLQVTATVNAKGDVMTYRDAAGRLMGTKTTSSGGKVVFRDASGRLTGPDFR